MGLCLTDDEHRDFIFLKSRVIFHKVLLPDRLSDHLADEVN